MLHLASFKLMCYFLFVLNKLKNAIWNAIVSDMFIKTTCMRYRLGEKRIRGATLKAEALMV